MKQIISLFIILLPFTTTIAQSQLDNKNGFKDLQLGSEVHLTGISHTKVEDDGEMVIYSINDDKYIKVGECRLKEVVVYALNHKIYSIILRSDGLNSGCILAALKSLYGNPLNPDDNLKEFVWDGVKVNMIYNENLIDASADIALASKLMEKEYKVYKINQSKRNSSGL